MQRKELMGGREGGREGWRGGRDAYFDQMRVDPVGECLFLHSFILSYIHVHNYMKLTSHKNVQLISIAVGNTYFTLPKN